MASIQDKRDRMTGRMMEDNITKTPSSNKDKATQTGIIHSPANNTINIPVTLNTGMMDIRELSKATVNQMASTMISSSIINSTSTSLVIGAKVNLPMVKQNEGRMGENIGAKRNKDRHKSKRMPNPNVCGN